MNVTTTKDGSPFLIHDDHKKNRILVFASLRLRNGMLMVHFTPKADILEDVVNNQGGSDLRCQAL